MTSPKFNYYGLSTFSLQLNKARILVDPWFGPEWIETTPEDYSNVDYILVTHGAHDHLGATFPIAQLSNATVVTEPAVADHLIAKGLPQKQVESVVWGNELSLDGFDLKTLETRHISYFESLKQSVSGIALGFHFNIDGLGFYYLGDTAIFQDLKLFGDLYDTDVAAIPVGNAPGAHAPLPPSEAALAAEWIRAETVIPVHYVPGSGAREEFIREIYSNDQDTDIICLNPGESVEL